MAQGLNRTQATLIGRGGALLPLCQSCEGEFLRNCCYLYLTIVVFSNNAIDANCINLNGLGECITCEDGYNKTSEGCEDINECDIGLHHCHEPFKCQNTKGYFKCGCRDGFNLIPGECVGQCVTFC